MKIKKGDTVQAISGVSRGKIGKVLKVLPGEGRIVAEGLNIRKKHVRPRKQGQKGQIIEFPAPFDAAKAMLICPKCGKATRVSVSRTAGQNKLRACKKCKMTID